MNSRNDKEKWVAEVLNSMEGMKKAEGNPFLYEKIMYRLQNKDTVQDIPAGALLPKWIIAGLFLLFINSIAFTNEISRHEPEMHNETNMGILSEIGNQTTYNY